MKHYIELKKASLFYKHYVYVDTLEYLADSVFIQEKLRVFFGETYKNQKYEYVLVFCKVWKWDVKRFVCAMERFGKKLLVLGHEDAMKVFEEVVLGE